MDPSPQDSDADMDSILASIRSAFEKSTSVSNTLSYEPPKSMRDLEDKKIVQDIQDTLSYARHMSQELKNKKLDKSEHEEKKDLLDQKELPITLESLAKQLMQPAIENWLKENLYMLVKTYISARVNDMLEKITETPS
jgi:cell pole-organizing protein PopZ